MSTDVREEQFARWWAWKLPELQLDAIIRLESWCGAAWLAGYEQAVKTATLCAQFDTPQKMQIAVERMTSNWDPFEEM